ncbi:MAG: LuxR C-terminal-related transcriptional regulator [Rhodococcus sp. (in: high G+C Gram-positive bacteria)]|uniref:LuxR C-terminal-related transcriptional regulator n=1 Tax=Rhodococcus sp. TaxID=1831 RepID=UPI003BB17B4D
MDKTFRPSDQDALRAELRSLRQKTALPVLFGGTVEGSTLTLSGFVGTRSTILRDLVIDAERGAGGRAVVEQRPVGVQDYSNSRHITHEYDYEVGKEGIETLLAVPVVVKGRTRGTLYGGLRANLPLGDVVTDTVVRSAAALAREVEIRDEVDRRLGLLDTADVHRDARISEGITESYLALRVIADRLGDDALGAQVQAVEKKLRSLATREGTTEATVTLSRRERDVLAYAALGCRNAEIAERLSLSVETIKSYMRNVMGKLDAASRHEAVVEARRQGLLP